MKKRIIKMLCVTTLALAVAGCGGGNAGSNNNASGNADATPPSATENQEPNASATGAIGKTDLADANFDTSYEPLKDEYKIYCTYKIVHSWYDAIESGVKGAQEDFKEKGVNIDYEWYAPVTADAVDQVNSIETAIGQGWDLIAVDVNQIETTSLAVQKAVEAGVKVCTFASSDIPDSPRSFFVGNTDNYGDGATLAEAVIEKMGQQGQIAFLSGTIGAASHEQRLQAFYDVAAKYPDIEVVDEQRDDDFVEKAIQITESWLQAYPDLGGILCNNMSNPVGACQAVKDAGKSGQIVIGGMDHDLRTFNYLKDGTLFVAQVQNCYDMGYKMVYYAVQTIDGVEVPEVTSVGSTSVYQDEADKYINMLFN